MLLEQSQKIQLILIYPQSCFHINSSSYLGICMFSSMFRFYPNFNTHIRDLTQIE